MTGAAPSSKDGAARIERAQEAIARLELEVRKVYIGQDELVRGLILGFLARGNVLLEGAPGLGKTLLVRVLSRALSLRFSRIQFTPDLMPADITGSTTLVRDDAGHTDLQFRPGPVFAHLVLADEINRGTPKTQSALLEAMQEHAVTVGGQRRALDEPFMVIATQNPIEMEGTYPLPEAQLDRFLLKLFVRQPTLQELRRIGLETTGPAEPEVLPALSRDEVLGLQALAREIVVGPEVLDLAARLTMATHPDAPEAPDLVKRYVRYGASPRAVQALLLVGRAKALADGRPWVKEDDLRSLAGDVLRHRIFLRFEAGMEGVSAETLIGSVLDRVR